jgi:RNA polymerase sigma-70 factor, ECF subfamily
LVTKAENRTDRNFFNLDLTNDEKLFETIGYKDLDKLIPEVYAELKRLAAYHLRHERPNHTLRPTELVHEVYLQMVNQHSLEFQNRVYFVSLASTIMRRVLVNYAKSRNRQKRGAGKEKISFDEIEQNTLIDIEQNQVDVIALEESLIELAKRDERQVKIVEMHFFGGLTFDEIAVFLGLSLSSVMREWRFARSWLYKHLND